MMQVTVKIEGKNPPKVELKGEGWNRQKIDQVYLAMLRGLKSYKHAMLVKAEQERAAREAAETEAIEPKGGKR